MGEKIKEARLKKALSPKQLGKKCGVSESYILDIETGKKIINEKFLQQISKVLGEKLEENLIQEPEKEVAPQPQKKPSYIERPIVRQEINPVGQWSEALSGIIKEVPIFDIHMKNILGNRSFPIINKKVEGFNPDKLIYIKVPNDNLKGFRVQKDDLILIYLNQEFVNNSITLIEHEEKIKLRKIKKISGNKIELIGFNQEVQTNTVELNSIRIIGRGLRLEVDLKG